MRSTRVAAALASCGLLALVSAARADIPDLAPLSFVQFCKDHPEECQASHAEVSVLTKSRQTLELLEQVNSDVNEAITPEETRAEPRRWSIYPQSGDCNDFAVTKRHELMRRGVPSGALRLAAVQLPDGEDHLVLIVATDAGELVLDNLLPAIRPFRETRYRLVRRQSAKDPKLWVRPS